MDEVTKFGVYGIAVAVFSIGSTVMTMFGLMNIALAFEVATGGMLILMLVNAVSFLRR